MSDYSPKAKLTLRLISYGLKTNKGNAGNGFRSIPVADFYLDCRGVPDDKNRIRVSFQETLSLRKSIESFGAASLDAMFDSILESIEFLESRRDDRADPFADPYVVCFFCAFGMHRSKTCKQILAERLVEDGWKVEVI